MQIMKGFPGKNKHSNFPPSSKYNLPNKNSAQKRTGDNRKSIDCRTNDRHSREKKNETRIVFMHNLPLFKFM